MSEPRYGDYCGFCLCNPCRCAKTGYELPKGDMDELMKNFENEPTKETINEYAKDHSLKFISWFYLNGWTVSDPEYMLHKENIEYKTIEEVYDEYTKTKEK